MPAPINSWWNYYTTYANTATTVTAPVQVTTSSSTSTLPGYTSTWYQAPKYPTQSPGTIIEYKVHTGCFCTSCALKKRLEGDPLPKCVGCGKEVTCGDPV